MKININLKNILKYLILFVLACIFIYYSNIVNVKAEGGTTTSNSLGDIIFPTSIAVYDNLGTSLSKINATSYQSFSSEVATRAWVIQSTPMTSNGIVVSIPVPDLVYGHSYVLLNYWATSSTQRIGLAWANNLRFGLNRYLDNFEYQSYPISPYYSDVFPISNITLSIPVNSTQLANTLYVSTDITKFTNNVQNDTLSAIYFSQMSDGPSNISNYYYLGYRLIDITTLTTSQQEQLDRIEASINSLTLSEVNSKLDAIQQEQQNTSDAIDEQIQQDKEQHEAEMEQDKQQHEEQMESQKICQYIDKSSVLIDNKYLKNDGQLDNDNSYGITNYISISKNTKIKQLEEVANFWNSNFCFYNVNKTLIQCVSNNTLQKDQILNIPIGASYIRFSIDKNKDKPQFEICTNGNQALNDSLNNSDTSGANQDANNFFNNFENNDFGLSDIITLPLTTIQSITSKSCTPLSLTLPFVNKTFELPCMNIIYSKFEPFYSIYQTITFGVISYWVCVQIYAMVKGFKDPTSDEIEVMDL